MNRFICFVLLSSFSCVLSAESIVGNANVFILPALNITETKPVDFGLIPNGSGTCSMNSDGSLSGVCAGANNGTPGSIEVDGLANLAVNISLESSTDGVNIQYLPKLTNTNSNSGTETLDLTGKSQVSIIGDLELNGALSGLHTLTYTITVNYQ